MRARILGPHERRLTQEFEAPTAIKGSELLVWQFKPEPGGSRIAMQLQQGAGVWAGGGQLLFYSSKIADLSWLSGERGLLAAENANLAAASGQGVDHLILHLDDKDFSTLRSERHTVPYGELFYLVISHDERRALVTWLDQNVWGYRVIGVTDLKPTGIELYWRSSTISKPAFSGDDAQIVACHFLRTSWWNDEEDDPAEVPSPGGLRHLSTITSQSIATGAVATCEVMIELPKGWLPDRPWEGKWSNVWGPEFVSADEFKIWLPDGTERRLRLPLPNRVIFEDLNNTRPWID